MPVLRRAVRAHLGEKSLRQVAREVGLSPTGLAKFLEGTRPYAATRQKLERWYVQQERTLAAPRLTADTAWAIVRVLVQDLALPRQKPALASVVRALDEAYGKAEVPTPKWLAEVVSRGTR